jgi:transcriptional regulator with XRE-family HTH domain
MVEDMYPNLKLQLWKSGIRQNRLAKMLGMDETVLSKIINGFRHPSLQTRRRIADLLETDERWLFDTGEPGPNGTFRHFANNGTQTDSVK